MPNKLNLARYNILDTTEMITTSILMLKQLFPQDHALNVRYDNERSKGDHRHVQGKEESYNFTTVENLLNDFDNDVRSLS